MFKSINPLFAACMMAASLISLVPGTVSAAKLTFDNNLMSADLNQIALKDVLEQLRTEKGVWWEADPALLKSKITVNFQRLNLDEGVERILRNFNHSFIFNADGQLAGIKVVTLGTGRQPVASDRPSSSGSASAGPPIASPGPHSKKGTAPGINPQKPALDSPAPDGGPSRASLKGGPTQSPSTPDNRAMQNDKNGQPVNPSGPPGSDAEVSQEVRDTFKVKKNQIPPGGGTKPTPEMMKKFKVIKGLPSPDI